MAQAPYFVVSPNMLLSLIGLARGRGRFTKVAQHSREVKIDVVIPARNEAKLIPIALDSLARQTRRPDRVILIDDNSSDRTVEFAEAVCKANGLNLEVRRRTVQEGKTPSVREVAYGSDAEIEFVLDGDTVLVDANYLERVADVMLSDDRIAAVCGLVKPLFARNRDACFRSERLLPLADLLRQAEPSGLRALLRRGARAVTNLYRDVLYFFLQHLVYRGQISLFGTMVNPVGCAVGYRRKYLRGVFEHFKPTLGDNLTVSEDIFIGFAFVQQGLRNVQLDDIACRSMEPEAQKAPRQVLLWSSAFVQCCYYFPGLVATPFKWVARMFRRRPAEPAPDPALGWQAERDRITRDYGRGIGWSVFLELFEKASFPLVLIAMLALRWWETLWITLLAESGVLMVLSFITARREAPIIALKTLIAAPLRYGSILLDVVTFLRFFFDVFVNRAHRWRK
jgi:hypothetical protein